MADVSYESLQSQIGQQKTQITSQRQIIQQQKISGERGIQALKRVHPRADPSVWFGERKPQIESIKGRLSELGEVEKELSIAETNLSQQEQLLKQKESEGWKIREKNGEFEFYKITRTKTVPTTAPRGQVSAIKVHWINREGKTVTSLTEVDKLESIEKEIREVHGGRITRVETHEAAPHIKSKELWKEDVEALPLIVKEPAIEIAVPPLVITDDKIKEYISKTTPPPESYVPAYQPIWGKPPGVTGTLRELTGRGEQDISTIAPTSVSIATTKAGLRIKREGIEGSEAIQKIFKQELRKQDYDLVIIEGETFVVKGTAESYEQRLKKIETTKAEIKQLMTGSPTERVAGLGLWVSTGLLSHRDPFGIVSGYQAIRGEPEKALEAKARAVVDLPIGKPWSPERFAFLGRAYTGPVAMVGITYGVSAGIGAGVGAFEATTVGKYPLLISRGVKVVAGVAKPLWTLTPAKAIEIGIGGYVGYEAVKRAIPVVAEARRTGEYGPLAGYLGSLAIYGYTGLKGYKLGKVFGYGRAEEYLYLRETYAPGTREYIRFKAALKVARELEPIKPTDIRTLDLAKDIQKLTPEGVEALYSVLLAKKRVITISGSAASYPQVRGARLPRDIDLLVSGWKHNLRFVQTRLKSEYGIDIHGKEFGYPGLYHRFGFLDKPRIKIPIAKETGILGRFKFLQASEQLFRKGVAAVIQERRYRWGEYPGFPKPPDVSGVVKGKKDIFDFVTHARSLITDAYKSVSTGGRAIRAERALELFLHPEKAPSLIKGVLPKPKPFFWKRAVVAPELLLDALLFKGKVYPKAYPIGTAFGYAPPTIPTELPSYMPSVEISYPKYVEPVKPPSYIPIDKKIYVPSKIQKYIPTIKMPYVPSYVPEPYITAEPPTYIPTPPPPYIPTKAPPYQPPYTPTLAPPYFPNYTPTPSPPYVPPYQPPYEPGYTPTIAPPPPPSKKKVIIIPDTPYKMFGHTIGQGYHTYVKERTHFEGIKKIKKGKMIRLSKRPLSRMDALSLGGMAIDNSAAATFEIRPVNAMAQEPLIKLKPFDTFQDKFYMKDNKYIEKPKYRIDTKGEVEGIPALAWYAERTKKAVKKKPVVARRPKERVVREPVDMFDFGMGDMINMDKIFKGVFDIGIQ